MSTQSDIISLDLRSGQGSTLDIASMFPFASTHAIRSTKPILDTLKRGEGKTYDFSLSNRLSLRRFRTIATLDLSTPEFWRPWLLTTKVLKIRPRFHTIDLVPPLTLPYGALDLRRGLPLLSERTYPDLYRRQLPTTLHIRREWKNIRKYAWKKRKSLLATLALLVSLSIPSLWYTRVLVEDGYARMSELRSIQDVEELKKLVRSINILYTPYSILPSDTIELGSIAIDAWLSLSRGLESLVATLPDGTLDNSGSLMRESLTETPSPSYRWDARDISPLVFFGIDAPTDWLESHQSEISNLKKSFDDAALALDRVRSLDDPRSETILHISATLTRLSWILGFYEKNTQQILALLGHEWPERYIVFNQNRDEIRANGGFPGSVITFTLYKGNILDYRTDDVYYYDWNLYPYKEIPPPWLTLLTDTYGLRDVNYYPDFRETLEKANTFIERSGDATITTGIAIHQGLIEDILEAVWPVTLSGVNVPFSSENFSPLMSTLVEARHEAENNPKDILFRFIGALAGKIHDSRQYDTVYDVIERSFRNGEILIASRDSQTDTFLAKFRKNIPWVCTPVSSEQWTPSNEVQIKQQITNNKQQNGCSPNWIYPILTSVSGNKSDRFMKRLYTSELSPIGSCRVLNKLTFTHTQGYSEKDTLLHTSYLDMIGLTDKGEREKMLYIQWNGKNRTYMRIYVPKGSTLTGSSLWIESVEKPEATVFTWIQETPVGASSSKTLRYELTLPNCDGKIPETEWYRQPWLRQTTFR